MIRLMTVEDYEQVHALWMRIKGFAMRSIDDSKEGVNFHAVHEFIDNTNNKAANTSAYIEGLRTSMSMNALSASISMKRFSFITSPSL